MSHPDHLCFFSDSNPGYKRKRWGRGFTYLDTDNQTLKDELELNRIKRLVIPPAWRKVWISPKSNSYLLCTGKDERGRKQYIYHPDWMAYRQFQKFDRLGEFGEQLPKIRRAYKRGLKENEWTKNKVVSLIVCLLDKHYFRIGNQHYTAENSTYGLTTLRRKHIQEDENTLMLKYKAKSGKLRKIKLQDKKITKLLREVSELPGYELFRFKESNGTYSNVDSADVNMFLKSVTDKDFTAKDFRTWGASKLAIEEYEPTLDQLIKNKRLKFETTLVKRVAAEMNNTVSVCRQYYIHPEILSYLVNIQPAPFDNLSNSTKIEKYNGLNTYERVMMRIIN